MAAMRLLQGVLFGLVLAPLDTAAQRTPSSVAGALLLVLALALYVKGVRSAIGAPDEDAPPPRWIAVAGSMSPPTAFAAGAGFLALSVKFLVFTLGAIGVLAEANLGAVRASLAYVLFVVLAQSAPLAILALASSSSSQAAGALDALRAWLARHQRAITVLFAAVFGTWFLLKALTRLGVV
jgi:hypothetical protein